MNIPLAIVLALVASGCFALGATLQHRGVERNLAGSEDRAMTARRFLKLLVTPLWLGGTALLGLGAALHVVGLAMAPLTVIQPVGILAVPFSILQANRLYHRTTSGRMWASVGMTVLGIVVFTVVSALTAVEHVVPSISRTLVSAGIVWALALVFGLLALRGPRWARSLLWSWCGAFLYGLGSAMIKLITITYSDWAHPLFWTSVVGLVTAYCVGAWAIQQAYATGPAEIVVGVMTTVDPVVAVVFGLLVLDEGRALTPLHGLVMLLSAAAACYGVFILSKFHPDAVKHREQDAAAGASALKKG